MLVRSRGGRPRKSFEGATSWNKKRRAEEGNAEKILEQVFMAYYYKLKEEGREQDPQVLKNENLPV